MTKSFVLGIDLGTQSLKIGIFDMSGQKIIVEQESFEILHTASGLAEQDPYDWWKALLACTSRAAQKVDLKKIKAISLCATSSTVVVTDKQLKPVMNAMSWMDQRAINEEEFINSHDDPLVKDVLRYSGGKVSVEWMVTKALWAKKHLELENKLVVEQLDWMNARLTGVVVASKCNASCKWNYIDHRGGFSNNFFEKIGLEDIFASWPNKVVKVGDYIGDVTEEAAKATGLLCGTPVYQGGIDAHIGMIGTNALAPGVMSLITGTSFVQLAHSKTPIFTEGLWGPYEGPLIDDYWLLEGGQLSCGGIISWFMREFYADCSDKDAIFNELEEMVTDIPIGSENLIMLDNWQGNRTPYRDPYLSGAFIGLTTAHTKYHIYRSILEGIAFGTKNVIQTYQASNVPIEHIVVGGGLVHNKLLMQMISDVTGIPIYVTTEKETGAKGAAIVAAYGFGIYDCLLSASQQMVAVKEIYKPDYEKYEQYQEKFALSIQITKSLAPFMKQLKVKKEGVHEPVT